MKVLVAYNKYATHVATTKEYLDSFSLIEDAEVDFLNVVHTKNHFLNLNYYDVVIVSYCARLFFSDYVSDNFKAAMKNFSGVKAIFIQDEYDNVNKEVEELNYIGPDIIFTCVPLESVDYVYSNLDKKVKFHRVLTGYVPNRTPDVSKLTKTAARKNVVAYRGRKISASYGELGYLKYIIGPKFKEKCKGKLKADIAWDERSRIYGDYWYEWLEGSKATLVTESGSNVFDFTGGLREKVKSYEDSQQEIPKEILDQIESLDSKIKMAQISPRVFEALAYGCALVAFEGDYSDVLVPGKHYLSLKKDFSNIEEVIETLKNDDEISKVWKQAYDDIILSKKYSYPAFIKSIEKELISQHLKKIADGFKPSRRFFTYAETKGPLVYKQVNKSALSQITRKPVHYLLLFVKTLFTEPNKIAGVFLRIYRESFKVAK